MSDGTLLFDTKIVTDGLKTGLSGMTSLFTAAIGGITAFGAASVKVGSEFETSLAKASTLFSEIEGYDLQNLSDDILSISSATGVAASELAEAAYSAESAGVKTEDLAEMLEASSKLATAGFTDIDTALSATAKTMNAYGDGMYSIDEVQRILIQTQNMGITTVGELGASLAQVTPTAAAFSVGFEQVGAALAGMTAQGTPTAQATTQLNALIAELGKNGTTAAKNLEKAAKGTQYAGMSFNEMMKAGADLNDVLSMMETQADKDGVALLDMFSSIEAGKAAMSISNSDWQKNMEAMATEADVVGEAYGKMADTFETKMNRAKEGVKNLQIGVFEAFSNDAGGVMDLVNNYIGMLSDALATDGLEGLVGAIGGVIGDLVARAAEFAPQLVDMATSLLESFLHGIIDNADSIANSAAEIINAFINGIVELLPLIIEAGVQLFVALIANLPSIIATIVQAAPQIVNALIRGFSELLDQFKQMGVKFMNKLKEGLVQMLSSAVSQAASIGKSIVNGLWNGISSGWNWLKDKVSGLAKSLFDSAKSVLGIASPSKKFKWIGEMCVAGFEEGLEEFSNGSSFGAAVDASLGTVMANTGNGIVASRGTTFNFYDTQTSPDAIRRNYQNTMEFGLAGGLE